MTGPELPVKYGLLDQLMHYSAGRIKENTTIQVRILNFKEELLTLEQSSTKTKETRQVPNHPRALEDLNHWARINELKKDDYVFVTDSKNTNFRKGEKVYQLSQQINSFAKHLSGLGLRDNPLTA